MKKIQSLVIFVFLICCSFSALAQTHFILNFGPEYGKTNIYFNVNPPDQGETLQKLYASLGKPAADNGGEIQWNDITIEGVGSGLTILVIDGIFTRDAATRRACFVTFKSRTEKQILLQNINENQERNMKVQIKNSKGEDFQKDGKTEIKLRNFLDQKTQ
jgi:hypothetical protein